MYNLQLSLILSQSLGKGLGRPVHAKTFPMKVSALYGFL